MFLVRRLVWFTSGATAGFGGALWIRRRILRAVRRYAPEQIQAEATASVRRLGSGVRDAVAEGRRTMREREAQLRAELRPGAAPTGEGRPTPTLPEAERRRGRGPSGPAPKAPGARRTAHAPAGKVTRQGTL